MKTLPTTRFASEARRANYQLLTTNWRTRRPGLALVELIAGLGIGGIALVMIAAIYIAHFRLFSNQNTSIEVSSQNKIAIDEITNQIRESQAVVATCALALCPLDSTSDTVVILQIWPIDSAGELFQPAGSDYDFIIYKRDSSDNTLVKKIIPGTGSFRQASEKIIATNISNLLFSYDDDANPTSTSQVMVNLTTSANSGGKTITSSQTSKAVLRNK